MLKVKYYCILVQSILIGGKTHACYDPGEGRYENIEAAAHQQLQNHGIAMTDFAPANKYFLMVSLIQHLID
ncbi:hypothetical protein [Enterobacter cloacae]